jgi:hypothetical protein
MSFIKTSVSIPMFNMRIQNVFDSALSSYRDYVEGMDRSTPLGKKLWAAVAIHVDSMVSFAMQFSVKTHLKPQESEDVLSILRGIAALVTRGEEEYYWKRFSAIPKDRGDFARAHNEYLMAGNAFLELCGGKTGMQELDDLIRQFGAETFRSVCRITKKEIKSVRLYP